jgi:hypothetical protein
MRGVDSSEKVCVMFEMGVEWMSLRVTVSV